MSHYLRKQTGLTPPRSPLKTCVIVLNYHLPKCTEYLWRQAEVRVCADGGALRLRQLQIKDCPAPHFVVGDLDSVTRDVLGAYEKEGTEVLDLSHDQDTTDLDKCYRVIQQKTNIFKESDDGSAVLVLGAFGGKWDREMSNLHVMMKYRHIKSVLVGDSSHAHLLLPGVNTIEMDFELEGPGCALIPLGHKCLVTTKGLKWNLQEQHLSFGDLVSTSNQAVQNEIRVETDNPLVWVVDSNLSYL